MTLYHILKRGVDIVISLIGVILLIPFFLVISIWIKLTSKGPVIYKHTRIGKNGKPFTIYKFRSMVVNAREMQQDGMATSLLVTSAGKFLRKTFLDETPQLVNILKGDLALIGPRPFDQEAYAKFTKKHKQYKELVKVRPGMTSLESVVDYLPKEDRKDFEKHFKKLIKQDKFPEYVNYEQYFKHKYILDKYYIDNESLFLDIRILFYTSILFIERLF